MGMLFDLHIHTARHSPDSSIDPFELVRRARAIGLDGVVITEHDWLWTEDELNELRAAAPGLIVLAGVEVSAHAGHVLCYGVTNPFRIPKDIPWAELCDEVHRQGGAAVAAHPFRWDQPFEKFFTQQRPAFDGLEVMSKNLDAELRGRVREFRSRHPHLSALGNSDAHAVGEVGCCRTEFGVPVRTNAELVAAIRAGRATPRAG